MHEKLWGSLLLLALQVSAGPVVSASEIDPLADAFAEELAAAPAAIPSPGGALPATAPALPVATPGARLAIAPSAAALAATTAAMTPVPSETSASPAAAPSESVDSLLPSTLGPMEHVFWGRHGLMRGVGFPLTEDGRETELGLRRTMLTLHEIGGFLTLGLMTWTVITGQQIVNDPGAPESLYARKRLLADWTVASYFTTAGLSLLTPPPMIRRKQFSSLTLHKIFGVVHFTGMVIAPILGSMIQDASGADYDTILRYHQINGYVTLAAMTGAMLVITFN